MPNISRFRIYGKNDRFNSEIYNQFYNVEDKKINGVLKSSNYFRAFPIFGVDFETPFKFKDNKSNFIYFTKPFYIF